MSGSAIRKAMVDLCRARRRPDLRRRGTLSRAAWTTPLAMARLGAHVALELRGGPADRLVDRIAALRAARDHLRVDRLHVHLLRDAGRGRRARHPGHLGARRVVIYRALRRLDQLPDLEVAHALERGNVVAAARIDDPLDVLALQQVREQALRRRLVPGEFPYAPQERQERRVAALRPLRHLEGPQLLGDLQLAGLGDRPGARRVEDERALPRDQVEVVGGVVPGEHVGRQRLHQALRVLDHATYRVRLHGDVALRVDELRAVRGEERAHPVYRVGGLPQAETERIAGLERLLRGDAAVVPGPVLGFPGRPPAGRIHRLHVDAALRLEEIDARAGRLHLRAGHRRHAQPVAF